MTETTHTTMRPVGPVLWLGTKITFWNQAGDCVLKREFSKHIPWSLQDISSKSCRYRQVLHPPGGEASPSLLVSCLITKERETYWKKKKILQTNRDIFESIFNPVTETDGPYTPLCVLHSSRHRSSFTFILFYFSFLFCQTAPTHSWYSCSSSCISCRNVETSPQLWLIGLNKPWRQAATDCRGLVS